MPPEQPLHQLDPLNRFSSRAEDYARYRPDYPVALFDFLLEQFPPDSRLVAADVGAGTGISSAALAARGFSVIAIEPNVAMRQAIRSGPRLEVRASSAEDTGLIDHSVDLVGCFQAFHWFRPEAALVEFHRILRENGLLAVVWNLRDRADPMTAAYSEIVKRHAITPAAEERPEVADPLLASALFDAPVRKEFPHAQRLPPGGLLGRARSTSYLPSEGDAAASMRADILRLEDAWKEPDGCVTLRYRTQLHLLRSR